jgi:hypothetical protein
MAGRKAVKIRAIAFPEGDHWIVQGIEFDICTRAKDPGSVPAAFMKAVIENVCITEHLGRNPLQGIKPAPAKFQKMFEEAETELRSVKQPELSPISLPGMAIRLARAA